MTDSLIPIAPGFETPLEMIEACHDRLQAQLETLDRLAKWLPDHGVDRQVQQAATNVIRYFDVAAVNHHLDEEQDLFPLLLERVDAARESGLRDLIDWVLNDHQRMFAEWAAMRARLEPLSRGEESVLDIADARRFADIYRFHIEREEGEVLPYARALLGEADIANLAASMTARRRQPRD